MYASHPASSLDIFEFTFPPNPYSILQPQVLVLVVCYDLKVILDRSYKCYKSCALEAIAVVVLTCATLLKP